MAKGNSQGNSQGNKTNIYTLGGTVQAGDGVYIPRQADEELLALCEQSVFAYVLTSRQMGKSSLMVRTVERLAGEEIQSVVIDLTQLGVGLTAGQWYLGLLSIVEDTLMLDTDVVDWWEQNSHLGFTQRLTQFFEKVLLVEVTSPVVIFIDEIDTTLSLDFTDDFFAAIRYLYVARAQNSEFQRLSFVLIGVATPGDLIRDGKRTPFNIGQRVDLTDFTFEEALPLAEGLGAKIEPAQQLLRQQLLKYVLEWTGGHPYLTQRLCSIISDRDKDSWSPQEVKQVVSSTFLGSRSKQDNNLQFVRDMLTKRAPDKDRVLSVYREICLAKNSVVDEEQSLIKSHLKLSGVVRREDNALRVRNRIYQEAFNADWVENELAQQRPYSQALMAWLEAKGKDESRLLRGQALQDALAWGKDKSLSYVDYQFLAASQELDKREIQFALAETEKKAKQIVIDARIGLSVLAVGVLGVFGAAWYGQKLIKNAQTVTEVQQKANSALQVFDIHQIDELVSAMEAGQDLQQLVGKDRFVENYPVTNPLRVLKEMLYDVKERNRLKDHTNTVNSAIFSSDGKRILTASSDNTARIWRMEELDDLLARGCDWLNDYLIINPEKLKTLEVCQTPSNLKAAVHSLVEVGEKEAKDGNIHEAVATFKTALEWNPELKLDPQKKAQLFEKKGKAERLVSEGSSLAEQKKIKEAIAAYNQAQKIDPEVEIDPNAWNRLCRQGSLNKSAKEVMFACENAVTLAPHSGIIRDSRGLARALTGDYKGAIPDFEAYIAQTSNKEIKAQRQGWVKALREGKNPFTKEELEKLRN